MPNYTLYYFNGRGRAEICRMLFAAAGVKYTDKRFEFSEWERYKKDMPCMCVPVLEIDGKFKMPETLAIARYLAREFGFYGRSPMDMMRCDYICDCFYELMHDYMRYYHWKNGRFRFSGHGMGSVTPSGGMSRGAVMSSGSMSTGRITSGGTVSSGMASGGITSVGVSSGGVSSGGVSSGGVSSGGVSSGGVSSGGMVTSRMSSSGMSSSGVTSGGMVSSDMSGYDKYMYWRYMNTCNRVLPFLEKTLSMHKSGNQFFMGEQMMWCDMMCYCCLENPYMENQSMFSNYPKLMALRTRVASHQKISTYLKGRSHTMW